MFALEVDFNDSVSQVETIYVRRPQALIGASEFAHVVVEDLKGVQLRLSREIGRKFQVVLSGNKDVESRSGSYDGFAELNVGDVSLRIVALDFDLATRDQEPPDKSGVRVLRRAAAFKSPQFPAIALVGAAPVVLSIHPDQTLIIGRSKKCALRVEAADISAEHARFGFDGGTFWVEDLGSKNGTFVKNNQVAGRTSFSPGEMVVLGRDVAVTGVISGDQLTSAFSKPSDSALMSSASVEGKFPVVYATSDAVRPPRFVLSEGAEIQIGRDPACDIWLGAPHASRKHCSIQLLPGGRVSVTDSSTNGTGYLGGVLRRGEQFITENGKPATVDFGGGIVLAICYSNDDEEVFKSAGGKLEAFGKREVSGTMAFTDSKQLTNSAVGEVISTFSGDGKRFVDIVLRYRNSSPWGRAVIILTSVVVCLFVLIIFALVLRL